MTSLSIPFPPPPSTHFITRIAKARSCTQMDTLLPFLPMHLTPLPTSVMSTLPYERMRIRYSRIYGGTDILSRVEGVTWVGVKRMGEGRGHVIVALSVTTTGETRPVSGMGMREGWIYRLENTGSCTYTRTRISGHRMEHRLISPFVILRIRLAHSRFFEARAYDYAILDDNAW